MDLCYDARADRADICETTPEDARAAPRVCRFQSPREFRLFRVCYATATNERAFVSIRKLSCFVALEPCERHFRTVASNDLRARDFGLQIVEENDVRRMPECGGDGAARLAGDDHFEQAGRRRQIAEQRVIRIGGERSGQRQMLEDCEDV